MMYIHRARHTHELAQSDLRIAPQRSTSQTGGTKSVWPPERAALTFRTTHWTGQPRLNDGLRWDYIKQPYILKSVVVNGKTEHNLEKAINHRYLTAYLILIFHCFHCYQCFWKKLYHTKPTVGQHVSSSASAN
uniref:Uncharacterized protein n=1 Tax=Parascaris univalens TaxID=6257 RepID=A0A914ZHF6_PARUN